MTARTSATTVQRSTERALKRAFDVLASLVGLVGLTPLLALIAIAIKRDSKGPVLYRGSRVGRNREPFRIFKFRTMVETPEAHDGPKITTQGDPRVTSLGQFLRDSKLNELPQLINVLKGEMSLVGPRPEDPAFVEHYTDEQLEVLSVRPGITSLASVIYADEENRLDGENIAEAYLRRILPDKLRLDLIYVRNQSFLLDLDILFRTFMILLPRFRRATLHAEDVLIGPFRLMRRLVTWFSIDAAISAASVAAAGLVWRLAGPIDLGLGRAVLAAWIMAAVFTLVNSLTGVQRVQWRYASAGESVGVMLSVVVATIILLVGNHLLLNDALPMGMLIIAGVFSLTGFLGVRYRRRLFSGARASLGRVGPAAAGARERVIVVGAGEAGQLMIWLLQNSQAASAFYIAGVVDDDFRKVGTLLHGVRVLGTSHRLADFVEEYDAGLIIFAIHTIEPERRREILERCWDTGARTVVAPDLLTFLRSAEESSDDGRTGRRQTDRRTRVQMPGDGDWSGTVHRLAELARVGEYARVTEELLRLDRELEEHAGEPGSTPAAPAREQGSRREGNRYQVTGDSSES